MADPSNGQMTIYSNDMKSYGMRRGVAEFLGMPREKVRVVWMEGPQGYGRTAADDAGCEAAYLAKEIGRPVRVQWMRDEETAWDTKAPAFAVKMRGGLDAAGNLVALDYDARAADYNHVGYNEPDTVLIAQLMGIRRANPAAGSAATSFGDVRDSPSTHDDSGGEPAAGVGDAASHRKSARSQRSAVDVRLRIVHRRTGGGGESRSAGIPHEAADGQRPLTTAGSGARGRSRSSRRRPRLTAGTAVLRRSRAAPEISCTGRGIAYSFRGQTVVAEIAEVEVNRRTGHVWVKRLVCAHDCGLVVNPESLRHTIECAMLHSLSRTLHEEVQFDTEKVTSVDWISHPTLTHADAPERIDVVLVNGDPNPNRPDLPPYGAGEAACKPMLAAVANAIYDATGVRLRRIPFRAPRVLAALQAARV